MRAIKLVYHIHSLQINILLILLWNDVTSIVTFFVMVGAALYSAQNHQFLTFFVGLWTFTAPSLKRAFTYSCMIYSSFDYIDQLHLKGIENDFVKLLIFTSAATSLGCPYWMCMMSCLTLTQHFSNKAYNSIVRFNNIIFQQSFSKL